MSFTKTEKVIHTNLELTGREILFIIAVVLKMIVEILGLTVIPFTIGAGICDVAFKVMTYTSYGVVVVSFLLTPKITTSELIRRDYCCRQYLFREWHYVNVNLPLRSEGY